jgi:hypothetical protein
MTYNFSLICSLFAFIREVIQKTHTFKSFTAGLTVQESDETYEEMAKRYDKHEIQRLSKRKNRERSMGAGRHFKLDVKNRFLMLLLYYRLYVNYTFADFFLFDLVQSNIHRDIQTIDNLIRKCVPIPQKTYNITKRLKTPDEIEKYFPGFLAFIDSTEQQIPRPFKREFQNDIN